MSFYTFDTPPIDLNLEIPQSTFLKVCNTFNTYEIHEIKIGAPWVLLPNFNPSFLAAEPLSAILKIFKTDTVDLNVGTFLFTFANEPKFNLIPLDGRPLPLASVARALTQLIGEFELIL